MGDRILNVNRNINQIHFDTKLFLPNADLQTFVKDESRAINVDPVAFVSHLLPAAGHLMSGLKTQVVFHKKWKEPTILFNICVAPKSAAKTPVMNVIIKEIKKIEKEERVRAQRDQEMQDEEDETSSTFNPLAHVRVFSQATSQGLLHALNAGSGNMLGVIDEMSSWNGLTDPRLAGDLLSAYNAIPSSDLTVTHRSVEVDKPYINLSCNMQTKLMHQHLQKDDPVEKYGRYSIFAVRNKFCKLYSLEDQMVESELTGFSLKKLFQNIIDAHEDRPVEYHFSEASLKIAKEFISTLNAMSAGNEDEDFESVCAKSRSKFLRVCGVQTALRNAMETEEEEEAAEGRRGRVKKILIHKEDALRAKRCTLYNLASWQALRDKPVKEGEELDETPENDPIVDDQPSLPRGRKFRRKSGDLPDVETSTLSDLVDPKIGKHLARWSANLDENDKVPLSLIRRNRWYVRNQEFSDEDMLNKLIELAEFHGVMVRMGTSIKLLRSSSSTAIQSRIQVLKEEIDGYLV